MANKTNINDLNQEANRGELTDSQTADIAGGQSQRLQIPLLEDTMIDTIHGNNSVIQDVKHDDAAVR